MLTALFPGHDFNWIPLETIAIIALPLGSPPDGSPAVSTGGPRHVRHRETISWPASTAAPARLGSGRTPLISSTAQVTQQASPLVSDQNLCPGLEDRTVAVARPTGPPPHFAGGTGLGSPRAGPASSDSSHTGGCRRGGVPFLQGGHQAV
ncbi:hypothetical protein ACFWR4_12255 [Streptomyces hydrogenans]|uniref:hypothetical protein n=1 Tax=Streptomyces hydrogenans TaxID=1873719 RepID=UPI003661B372